MKFRAYMIGFEPPGWRFDRLAARTLMLACDFTAVAPDGIELGAKLDWYSLARGSVGTLPREGALLVCVGHESGGKVAVLSDEVGSA